MLVAYEEIVEAANLASRCHRQRQTPIPNTHRRIGHPSLVGGDAARIGGEIEYSARRGAWVITNKSGRYGLHLDRNPEHLRKVGERFASHGIGLEPLFVGGTPR